MKNHHSNRLVILSGPSCAGKSPLTTALSRIYPQLWQNFQQLVLYNDRDPRPGERDGVQYHFRSSEEIRALKDQDNFVFMEVRGDLQALALDQLHENLSNGDVLYEGNPFIATRMLGHPSLQDVQKLSVFLSPISGEEISYLKTAQPPVSVPDLVTDLMRRKLLRRTRKQKGEISLPDLENIERRANSAFSELQMAHLFQYVIPNHDGEDSENWEAFYHPLGDARKSLNAFVSLLQGEIPGLVESWEKDLLSL